MIAHRLGLSKETAGVATRQLISWGLVTNEKGVLRKKSKLLRWTASNSVSDIRKFHTAMLEEAKQRLATCLHEIANDLCAEEGDEVYHLAAQLFPLTKSSNGAPK